MRIVQVSPYSWDSPGGVQAHVRQLAGCLTSRGHDVLILAPGDGPRIRDGVRIVGRPIDLSANGSVAPVSFDPRAWRSVGKALRAFEPDVVHVHEPFAPSVSMIAVLRSPAPVVATFHANMGHEHWQGRFFTATAPLLRAVWRRLVRRIAVSRAARRSVRRRFATGAITIVPNGTDTARFASGTAPLSLPAGPKLLFVGRLERRKGFPVALGAFEMLARERSDLQLLVVGDGTERDSVDGIPPAVRSRIHMLGRVSDAELPDYHAAANIFLAPATGGESFGIVLVEAMAAGLPVVGSDIHGYREVARDGKEALLVRPSDAEALASGVRRLLDDDVLAKSLGARGRVRAKQFDWSAIVERLERLYVEAITAGEPLSGSGERGAGSGGLQGAGERGG